MIDETKTEIVLWSSMVSGYVSNGEQEYALLTFHSILREQIMVDRFSVTSQFLHVPTLGFCFWVKHTCADAHIQKIGYTLHVHLGFAYIYMYAKCGSLNY